MRPRAAPAAATLALLLVGVCWTDAARAARVEVLVRHASEPERAAGLLVRLLGLTPGGDTFSHEAQTDRDRFLLVAAHLSAEHAVWEDKRLAYPQCVREAWAGEAEAWASGAN